MSRNIFNSVKMTRPGTNVFDLSHDVKFTGKMGALMPVCCLEAIPGDKFNIGAESLIRFAPMITPVMHRFDATIHYFFCPNRLLWANWEKYITNTKLASGLLPAFPTYTVGAAGSGAFFEVAPGDLLNFLGVPTTQDAVTNELQQEEISALPMAAYQMIYDQYYRDQNNVPTVFDEAWMQLNGGAILQDGNNDGQQDALFYVLRDRAWEHDYFTSALPWAQKGDVVDIPLAGIALDPNWLAGGASPRFQDGAGVPNPASGAILGDNTGVGNIETALNTAFHAYDPDGSLILNSTTINDLRRAYKLQEWLEKNARGGTRYIENILAHFGVKSSDARLQRPEYITGVKTPISISEVLNTSDTTNAPQGNMAGHGVAVVNGRHGYYSCEEHGYIIGIMSVLPKPAYMQGIPKHFSKINHPTDFAFPSFANIGEQPIKVRELFAYATSGDDTFGYTPRYAEYKYEPNRVLGEFGPTGTLQFWTATRYFENAPQLTPQFINMNAEDVNNIFSVADYWEQMYIHVYNKIKAVRVLPKYGTPTF